MKYQKLTLGAITIAGLILAVKTLSPSQLSLITFGAIPTGFIGHIVATERIAKRDRQHYSKLNELTALQKATESNLNKAVGNESSLKRQLEKLKTEFTLRISEFEESTIATQQSLTNYATVCGNQKEHINSLEIALREAREEIQQLQADLRDWDTNFDESVNTKARAIALSQFNQYCSENDELTVRAMNSSKRFYEIILKVQNRMQSMRVAANQVVDETNQKALDAKGWIEKEIDSYLTQIELLNEKVARLQRINNGELLEPILFTANYDINAQISNSLAKEFYSLTQIPLAVKGFQIHTNGNVDVGLGYSINADYNAIVETLKQLSGQLAKSLGLYKITQVKKLEITDCIQLTFRREPAIKDDEIKTIVGTADEFLTYIINHPIRYRLIANPGSGKSPVLAVMISAILKAGCKRGNKARGSKVENTLVTVSYPDAESSLKDSDYPLDIFLKYGNTTQANKSFSDAIADWQFRKQYPAYAEKFFHIHVWEELDNTIDSATDSQDSSEKLKKIAKQAGHNNVGFIVSGQSVMTRQIKGFSNDDRTLFTEIIIGTQKIRKYINTYGKGIANLEKLLSNLDDIEQYMEAKNSKITDEARELRLALVMDERSPKLYWLPNLDSVNIDYDLVKSTEVKAVQFKQSLECTTTNSLISQNTDEVSIVQGCTYTAIEPVHTPDIVAHCPHCGSSNLRTMGSNRYLCKNCNKTSTKAKIIFK